MTRPGSPEVVRVAVKIRADYDVNGNPQRGWLVYGVHLDTRDSARLGFVDEGYGGSAALRTEYPGVVELCTLDVPVTEYAAAAEPESGVTRCPCCGDDFMTADIRGGHPCDDCQLAGCERTADACGELGYWQCERAAAGEQS